MLMGSSSSQYLAAPISIFSRYHGKECSSIMIIPTEWLAAVCKCCIFIRPEIKDVASVAQEVSISLRGKRRPQPSLMKDKISIRRLIPRRDPTHP